MTKFNYTLDMAPDTVRYRVADATQAARLQQYHKLLNDLKPAIRSLVTLMDAIPDSAWPADVERPELVADMGACLTLLDAILRPGVPEAKQP